MKDLIKMRDDLKKSFPDAEHYILQHAVRLNGVVDVWNNGYTVYCKPENTYERFFNNTERNEYIKICLKNHPKRIPMKKLKSGRMSMQEFRNNQRQEIREMVNGKNKIL
ncbi:MAG: hypothetical protein EOM23_11080 [Candidatus Moranbacteria bacterium]|nr:hypothetical protein [Candidatus Moranbacteria bacterium]